MSQADQEPQERRVSGDFERQRRGSRMGGFASEEASHLTFAHISRFMV